MACALGSPTQCCLLQTMCSVEGYVLWQVLQDLQPRVAFVLARLSYDFEKRLHYSPVCARRTNQNPVCVRRTNLNPVCVHRTNQNPVCES